MSHSMNGRYFRALDQVDFLRFENVLYGVNTMPV